MKIMGGEINTWAVILELERCGAVMRRWLLITAGEENNPRRKRQHNPSIK
jgi:hypothetical protein